MAGERGVPKYGSEDYVTDSYANQNYHLRNARTAARYRLRTDAEKKAFEESSKFYELQMDREQMLNTYGDKEYDFEQISRDHSSSYATAGMDVQTLKAFLPDFRIPDDTPDEDNAIDVWLAEQFLEDYVSCNPEKRKEHLDRIFDRCEQGVHCAEIESADAYTRGLDARMNFRHLRAIDEFAHMEALIHENQKYVDNRLYTVQKREMIAAGIQYAETASRLNAVRLQAHGIAPGGGTFLREDDYGFAARRESSRKQLADEIPAALFATQVFANRCALLQGELQPYPSYYFDIPRSGTTDNMKIVEVKDELNRNPLDTTLPGIQAASKQFDNRMNAIFDPLQNQRLSMRGLTMFDMIYINGESVTQLYADKFHDPNISPAQRETLIKADVVSAMVHDRAKVDVATLMVDKDGKTKVVTNSIKPTVRQIQPPLTAFQRAINGLAGIVGKKPYKTMDEELAIAYATSDPQKDAKLAQAVTKVLTLEGDKARLIDDLNAQTSSRDALAKARDFKDGYNARNKDFLNAIAADINGKYNNMPEEEKAAFVGKLPNGKLPPDPITPKWGDEARQLYKLQRQLPAFMKPGDDAYNLKVVQAFSDVDALGHAKDQEFVAQVIKDSVDRIMKFDAESISIKDPRLNRESYPEMEAINRIGHAIVDLTKAPVRSEAGGLVTDETFKKIFPTQEDRWAYTDKSHYIMCNSRITRSALLHDANYDPQYAYKVEVNTEHYTDPKVQREQFKIKAESYENLRNSGAGLNRTTSYDDYMAWRETGENCRSVDKRFSAQPQGPEPSRSEPMNIHDVERPGRSPAVNTAGRVPAPAPQHAMNGPAV